MNILVNKSNNKSKTVNKRLENSMKTRTYNHNKFIMNLLILMLMLASTSIMAQLKLESVDYNSNLDGSVEFHLMFDGVIDKPEVFMTAQPARLAFDMANVLLTVPITSTRLVPVLSTGAASASKASRLMFSRN